MLSLMGGLGTRVPLSHREACAYGCPADVKDGEVTVTDAMERVAADIRLLLGLRLAVSEDRPLPYSTRFCAQRCQLRGHQEASRVLRALERLRVVECVGKMKPRGQPHGTKLYAAPRGGVS
jgi:hypothetical protein